MKILLTVHQFFPQHTAGTEVLTYSVACELTKRGHTVHILTGHLNNADLRDEDRFDEYDYEGIHIYRFHHAYVPMAGQVSMIEVGYDNKLAANYFRKILEKFKPDLVHFFHLNRLGTRLIQEAVNLDIPRFMTPTDFWTICPTAQLLYNNGNLCSGPNADAGNCIKHFAQSTRGGIVRIIAQILPTAGTDLLARLTRKGIIPYYPRKEEVLAINSRLETNIIRLNQLNGIIAPNKFMKDLLVRHGVSPSLITKNAFGINITTDEQVKRHLTHSRHHPFRIGFIGTLIPYKGCHVLIQAFKDLSPSQAVLKIYGNTEELPEYSEKLKLLAGKNDAIEFCGTFHNSKISEVLADLDVLVVPSLWYENTPLVIYSAQAAQCPVVASNFPGISEVIHNQINGLLFKPNSSADLTKQLSRLINDQYLTKRLSMNSQKPKSISVYVDELLHIWKKH